MCFCLTWAHGGQMWTCTNQKKIFLSGVCSRKRGVLTYSLFKTELTGVEIEYIFLAE